MSSSSSTSTISSSANFLEESIICPIDLGPMKDAVSFVPCSHKMCLACAEQVFGKMIGEKVQKIKGCPLCKKIVTAYYPDHTIRSLVAPILKLKENVSKEIASQPSSSSSQSSSSVSNAKVNEPSIQCSVCGKTIQKNSKGSLKINNENQTLEICSDECYKMYQQDEAASQRLDALSLLPSTAFSSSVSLSSSSFSSLSSQSLSSHSSSTLATDTKENFSRPLRLSDRRALQSPSAQAYIFEVSNSVPRSIPRSEFSHCLKLIETATMDKAIRLIKKLPKAYREKGKAIFKIRFGMNVLNAYFPSSNSTSQSAAFSAGKVTCVSSTTPSQATSATTSNNWWDWLSFLFFWKS